MTVKFEEEFRPFVSPCPVVVVDFNVYLHPILDWFEKNVAGRFNDEVEQKLIRAAWAIRINRGPEMLPYNKNYRFIVVADLRNKETGNYWRNDYKTEILREAWESYAETKKLDLKETPIHYKGNRGDKTENFYRVFDEGRDYCSTYYNFYAEPGYEADDIAGAIYRISRDNPETTAHRRQILLSTIDRDWSQLVDDDQRIYFANTRRPWPREKIQERLAGNRAVIEHTKHKMGYDLDHPRNLANWKEIHGDMGDNLPPNAPRELFDLCEPNEVFNVDKLGFIEDLRADLNDPNPNSQPEHYRTSMLALVRCLLEPPIET
ncbi:5'-3' exonuclease [Synechococcus phage S-CBWM1]|uniref:5'-3' exonuclease n=1 Tax=Synechococcus phage S-CBWM1 TaxID=2053653 RepID=A0A3G1L3Q2_9CAUD|nr:polymerase [Synechococcus phage S-CBWM1]ATW62815.1 5'-3' exonuclease [Synechococcus phage S-CBWM1]